MYLRRILLLVTISAIARSHLLRQSQCKLSFSPIFNRNYEKIWEVEDEEVRETCPRVHYIVRFPFLLPDQSAV